MLNKLLTNDKKIEIKKLIKKHEKIERWYKKKKHCNCNCNLNKLKVESSLIFDKSILIHKDTYYFILVLYIQKPTT